MHAYARALSGFLLFGMSGLLVAQLWKPAGSNQPVAPPNCIAWDRAASEGIAELIFDTSAAAEWKVDQAILQIRRARKNCRSGSVELAGHDYTSLHRALATSTGSVRGNSDSVTTSSAVTKSSQR